MYRTVLLLCILALSLASGVAARSALRPNWLDRMRRISSHLKASTRSDDLSGNGQTELEQQEPSFVQIPAPIRPSGKNSRAAAESLTLRELLDAAVERTRFRLPAGVTSYRYCFFHPEQCQA